jgi:hypothetical protein
MTVADCNIGLHLHWVGIQASLRIPEAKHLLQLNLGEPTLIQDFYITDDGGSRSLSVCVLFRTILLLFRHQKETVHTRFGSVAQNLTLSEPTTPDSKMSVYGYLFPRHISTITPTANGLTWSHGID